MKNLFLFFFITYLNKINAQDIHLNLYPIAEGKPCRMYSYLDSTFLDLLDSQQVVKLNTLLHKIDADVSNSELVSFDDIFKFTLKDNIQKSCYSYTCYSNLDDFEKESTNISYNGFAKDFKVPKLCVTLVRAMDSNEYKLSIYQFRGTELTK